MLREPGESPPQRRRLFFAAPVRATWLVHQKVRQWCASYQHRSMRVAARRRRREVAATPGSGYADGSGLAAGRWRTGTAFSERERAAMDPTIATIFDLYRDTHRQLRSNLEGL